MPIGATSLPTAGAHQPHRLINHPDRFRWTHAKEPRVLSAEVQFFGAFAIESTQQDPAGPIFYFLLLQKTTDLEIVREVS